MNVELNGQIAALLGWTDITLDGWGRGTPPSLDLSSTTYKSEYLPRFSANMTSADKIVDYIAALGWMVTIYTGPYKDQGVKCRCCIMRGLQDFVLGGVDAVADTRPLAICQAFIEAMERWSDG